MVLVRGAVGDDDVEKGWGMAQAGPVVHVVITVQENHTTDNYFRSMAAYGANVATDWPLSPNPPAHDQPHDRHAYFQWLTGQSSGGSCAVRHR
jgi:hypothetical protein